MPRPLLGEGPERARRVAVLRTIGIVVAVALGVVGVWLIVTSDTQKGTEIGVLAGLWGLLIGAYSAFGSRNQHPVEPPIATMPAFDPTAVPAGGGVLDLRPRNEVERKAEAAARREFQARLEKVLRREVQETIARELSDLRAEVAALRSDLVEKVGGQLRLERIETTRLIGSDLEALQQQVRELRVLQSGDEATSAAFDALTIEDDDVTDVEAVELDVETVEVAEVVPDHTARAKVKRAEAERVNAERVEVERVEAERAEVERVEAERAEAERSEAERAEAERAEAERAEAERVQAERAEAERAEVERAEAERAEVERAEVERAEAERVEAERVEAERAEASRVEAERAEAERVEAQRVDAERAEAERRHRIGGFDGDPFASMPRLSPFTDFEPVADAAAEPAASAGDDAEEQESETSRRGRRYREDDSEDNVLARILQRERAQQ